MNKKEHIKIAFTNPLKPKSRTFTFNYTVKLSWFFHVSFGGVVQVVPSGSIIAVTRTLTQKGKGKPKFKTTVQVPFQYTVDGRPSGTSMIRIDKKDNRELYNHIETLIPTE